MARTRTRSNGLGSWGTPIEWLDAPDPEEEDFRRQQEILNQQQQFQAQQAELSRKRQREKELLDSESPLASWSRSTGQPMFRSFGTANPIEKWGNDGEVENAPELKPLFRDMPKLGDPNNIVIENADGTDRWTMKPREYGVNPDFRDTMEAQQAGSRSGSSGYTFDQKQKILDQEQAGRERLVALKANASRIANEAMAASRLTSALTEAQAKVAYAVAQDAANQAMYQFDEKSEPDPVKRDAAIKQYVIDAVNRVKPAFDAVAPAVGKPMGQPAGGPRRPNGVPEDAQLVEENERGQLWEGPSGTWVLNKRTGTVKAH